MEHKTLIVPHDVEGKSRKVKFGDNYSVVVSAATVNGPATSVAATSNPAIELFTSAAGFGDAYYELRSAVHAIGLTHPTYSSIYRRFTHNSEIFKHITDVMDVWEIHKAINAPAGSIIVMTPDPLGTFAYKFEIIPKTDPRYAEWAAYLPGGMI